MAKSSVCDYSFMFNLIIIMKKKEKRKKKKIYNRTNVIIAFVAKKWIKKTNKTMVRNLFFCLYNNTQKTFQNKQSTHVLLNSPENVFFMFSMVKQTFSVCMLFSISSGLMWRQIFFNLLMGTQNEKQKIPHCQNSSNTQ